MNIDQFARWVGLEIAKRIPLEWLTEGNGAIQEQRVDGKKITTYTMYDGKKFKITVEEVKKPDA